MLIGDKVRMLHGHGEGVVVRISGESAIVMLNEGIEIPLPIKHLVPVRSLQQHLPAEKKPEIQSRMERARPNMLFLREGLYLAGIPSSPMLFDLFLVNQSDYDVFLLAFKLAKPVNQFLAHFQITGKTAGQIPGSFSSGQGNHLTGLAFQFLKFHPEKGDMEPAGEFRIAFSSLPSMKKLQRIPILEKEGFLLQLDGSTEAPDPEKIRQAMTEGNRSKTVPQVQNPPQKYRELDLHLEALPVSASAMNPEEILSFQLEYFEKAMDNALIQGLETLVIIHGSGSGVLRNEIHRRLSQNRHIRFFRDAKREKFGYGATEVSF